MTDNDTPAFPVQDASKWQAHGMTLRDYFAASASESDIEKHIFTGKSETFVHDNSNGTKSVRTRPQMLTREEAKFHYADSMLKARQS